MGEIILKKNITPQLLPIVKEAQESLNAINQCVEHGREKFSELVTEIDKSKETIRNVSYMLRQQQDSLRDEYAQKFDEIIKSNSDKIEAHEGKLTELIGMATIGPISRRYERKANSEKIIGRVFLGFFYVLLIITGFVGAVIIAKTWDVVNSNESFWNLLKILITRFVVCIPLYFPLIWLLTHLNRRSAQKNRLAEEYDHKRLVVETYVGLADQLETLIKHGVGNARELAAKQLDKTISVVCFDACSLLDKLKVRTPVDGAVHGFLDLTSSIADAVKTVAGQKTRE